MKPTRLLAALFVAALVLLGTSLPAVAATEHHQINSHQ